MPGRSRLQCFGCPVLACTFNAQPFTDLDDTLAIASRAAELLRTNRIWLMGSATEPSVSGRTLYETLGDKPENELLARLAENRGTFVRNLAIEGATAGTLTLQEAATLARMRNTSTTSPNSLHALQARVDHRQELLEYQPETGQQRRTKGFLGVTEEDFTSGPRGSLYVGKEVFTWTDEAA
ncbi:MAG: hypothetical protein HYX52_05780 [Chloroflexi bacterium]|nr:hypothetical protein [Chloroflexota bacterium]